MTIEGFINTYNNAIEQKCTSIPFVIKKRRVTSERIRVARGLMGNLLCVNSDKEIVVGVETKDLKRFIDKLQNAITLEEAKND